MARRRKTDASKASANPTAAEMRQWYNSNKQKLATFEQSLDAVKQLRDVTKSAARSINSLDKDTVVGYLKNPNRYETQLRNASWYLISRSQVYQLIVEYLTGIFCLDARTVIPNYDPTSTKNDDKNILQSYVETLQILAPWNIENEFKKVIETCWIQDVSYNVAYGDQTGLFLLPLPADYCRIVGQYPQGDFLFYFNMNYLNSRSDYLEWWGEPFKSMQSGGEQWVAVPPQYSAAFKARGYDWSTIIPPLTGLFSNLIDLLDVSDIQAVANAQEIFKLVYIKLKTLSSANMADQWEIDPKTIIAYFNRMITEALPDYSSAAIVPGNDDLGVVDFSSSNKAAQSNKVLDATKNVMSGAGVGHILDTTNISTTSGYENAMKANQAQALLYLRPQIEGWFNRIAKIKLSNPSKIKFFDVGRYSKESLRKNLLEDAQYSLPSKMAVMSLDAGFSQLQMLAMNHLENDVLNLGEKFNQPLASSFTSGNEDGYTSQTGQGAPKKDSGDLTDGGSKSRENK